nr:MAG TPA: hypothetical protein [Caudoviricetes sp.]
MIITHATSKGSRPRSTSDGTPKCSARLAISSDLKLIRPAHF